MKILIILVYLLVSPVSIFAADQTAESCSVAHINTAIAAAGEGNTVTIPAGDCSWDIRAAQDGSVALNVTGLKLVGAGSGESGTNITITNADSEGTAIITSVSDWQISGMSFETDTKSWFAIKAIGNGWRIYSNLFTGFDKAIYSESDVGNLIDNNVFYGGIVNLFYNNSTAAALWEAATNLGGSNFTFIEDNEIHATGAATILRPVIALSGRRLVIRYNTFYQDSTHYFSDSFLDVHGYCHSTAENSGRGGRAYEIYENEIISEGAGITADAIQLRSGTGVIWNNKVLPTNQYYRGGFVNLYDWRAKDVGDSTGINSCYAVAPNTDGKYYCWTDAVRVLATGATYGDDYSFGDTLVGESSGTSGVIKGFDSDGHIYFTSITGGGFTSGESLSIDSSIITTADANSEAYSGEGYPCVDQVGRGASQASEPVYIWGNTDTNDDAISSVVNGFSEGYLTLNTDYYLSEKPDYTPYDYPHPLRGVSSPSLSGASCSGGSVN